jgi:hypothetical protein
MDWYIFLTPLLLLPIIFLFRLVGCMLDFDQFEVGRPPTYKLEGPDPSEGEVDVESENFTVSLLSGQMVTVTPNDDGDGGTFSPTGPFQLNSDIPSATFTYKPASVGQKTIATENDEGATDPPPIPYNSYQLINITFKLVILNDIPTNLDNPIIYIWPRFRVDDEDRSEPSIPYASDQPHLDPPPVTWESVAIQVPAGNHTCYCDLFMLRLGLDGITLDNAQLTEESINANPDHQAGRALTGPAIVDQEFVADTDITFTLHYTQTPGATDYLPEDFSIEIDIA